jgi:hypothetical protein
VKLLRLRRITICVECAGTYIPSRLQGQTPLLARRRRNLDKEWPGHPRNPCLGEANWTMSISMTAELPHNQNEIIPKYRIRLSVRLRRNILYGHVYRWLDRMKSDLGQGRAGCSCMVGEKEGRWGYEGF